MQFFKDTKTLFFIAIASLFIFSVTYGYIRFFILQDYFVAYEIDCDIDTESCFVGCVDEYCDEEYYFKMIERNAQYLADICGDDITGCAAATHCSNDVSCKIQNCDPALDQCYNYSST